MILNLTNVVLRIPAMNSIIASSTIDMRYNTFSSKLRNKVTERRQYILTRQEGKEQVFVKNQRIVGAGRKSISHDG